MFKKLTIVFFACLIAFSFSACEKAAEDDGSNPGSTTGNPVLAGKINTAVYVLMGTVIGEVSSKSSSKVTAPGTISFSGITGTGWSAHGNYQDTGTSTTWNITIIFDTNGYNTGDAIIKDGSINISGTVSNTAGTFSYEFTTGDTFFDVEYNSVTYKIGWDVTGSFDGSNYSFSGTYTLNGVSSTFSTSGVTK